MSSALVSAPRAAFWIAIAFGVLAVVSVYFSPLPGAFYAALFFASAWGIRGRQAWAAIALAFGLAAPVAGRFWFFALLLAIVPLVAAVGLWRNGRGSRRWWPWLPVVTAETCLAFGFFSYFAPAASMEKTILPGDCFLAESASWRLGRTPHRGDVVALRYPVDPKQIYIKRVVAVPGDRVRMAAKQLYVNGAPASEPYVTHSSNFRDLYRDNFPSNPENYLSGPAGKMLRENVRNGEVLVPQGEYFVLGDNRDNSADSRYWGFVPGADIIGSPLLIYSSYDLKGQVPAAARNNILNTRWSRLLKMLNG